MAISAFINQEDMHFADNRILLNFGLGFGQTAKCSIQEQMSAPTGQLPWYNTLYSLQIFGNDRSEQILDISEVIQSQLKEIMLDFPTLEQNMFNDTRPVMRSSILYIDYYILIEINNASSRLGPFRALSGGLNRSLLDEDASAFSQKRHETAQAILTTRTIMPNIVMKECEVYPLHFALRQGFGNRNLTITSNGKTLNVPLDNVHGSFDEFYALNVERIRKMFFDSHNIFPTQMDFHTNERNLCSLTIVEDNSPKPLVLIFKNTFGAYEKQALNPKFSIENKFEKNIHQTLNIKSHEFVKESSRAIRSDVMTASLMINSTEELIFALDILHSDDVWLEYQGKKQAVLVSAETVVRGNDFKPFAITLTIEPRITDPFAPIDLLSQQSRIFDLTFDDTFE